MASDFSKVSIYFFVCFPLADISKNSSVTCMGLQFSRIRLNILVISLLIPKSWTHGVFVSLFLRIGGTGRKAFTITFPEADLYFSLIWMIWCIHKGRRALAALLCRTSCRWVWQVFKHHSVALWPFGDVAMWLYNMKNHALQTELS